MNEDSYFLCQFFNRKSMQNQERKNRGKDREKGDEFLRKLIN